MNMIISNPTRNYIFFNLTTNTTHYEIYDLINIDKLRKSNLRSHEINISKFYSRPDQYKVVIDSITPIPPRSRWSYDGNTFICINNNTISSSYESNLSDLLYISERLSSVFTNKKIGVELSGGLDTSIVIGIIEQLGFNPYLIGMRSSRYELRTESYIQDQYAENFQQVTLINNEETLPFSQLLSTPIHQLPSSSSLYYFFAKRTAEECSKLGINIVLSGMGFDAILCENPNNKGENRIPDSWHTWMLDDNWFNENIFYKYDITYRSAAASQLLIKSIWALRKSEGEDLNKWWARNFFKDFLPSELVTYAYKADNSGGFLDGFINSKSDISNIFKVAYDITKFREFSPAALNDLYKNVHLVNDKKDKLILGRVSFANWIYGLIKEDKIKT